MPLMKGSSRQVISTNIHEMVQSGMPPNRAVAAALHNADESRKSRGTMKVSKPKRKSYAEK